MDKVMDAGEAEQPQISGARRLRAAMANGSMLVAALVTIEAMGLLRQHYMPGAGGALEMFPLLVLGAAAWVLAFLADVVYPSHPARWTRAVDYVAKMLFVIAIARGSFDLVELAGRAALGSGCVSGVRDLLELCTVLLVGGMLYDRMQEPEGRTRR